MNEADDMLVAVSERLHQQRYGNNAKIVSLVAIRKIILWRQDLAPGNLQEQRTRFAVKSGTNALAPDLTYVASRANAVHRVSSTSDG
jgi:hypothetical protein